MVVFVLVLIWLVVILPIAVRKLSEFQLVSSVARFQHRTELLERAHANFVGANGRAPVSQARGRLLDETQLAVLRAVQARIDARRVRRRETLLLLGSGICSTLLVGSVPSLHAFWVAAVFLASVTGVYLLLLVRCAGTEARAAERARKIVAIATVVDEAEAPEECRVIAVGEGGNVIGGPAPKPPRPRLVLTDRAV